MVDFYAAPVRFPVFRAAPVRGPTHAPSPSPAAPVVQTNSAARDGSADSDGPSSVMFTPRPAGIAPKGPFSPTGSGPSSPTSPVKARIAAAVANATAAAQNAKGEGAPLDVDALMRSLAALGKELQPDPAADQQGPGSRSRADQHEAKMRRLRAGLDTDSGGLDT